MEEEIPQAEVEIKGSEKITAELRAQQNESKQLFTKIYFLSQEIEKIKKQIQDIDLETKEESSQEFYDILINPYLNNEYKSYINMLLLKEEDNEELKQKLFLKKLENSDPEALDKSRNLYKQNSDLDTKINQDNKKQIEQEQKQLSDLVKELKEELKKINQEIQQKENEERAETDKISLYIRQLKAQYFQNYQYYNNKEIQWKNSSLQKEISSFKSAKSSKSQKSK